MIKMGASNSNDQMLNNCFLPAPPPILLYWEKGPSLELNQGLIISSHQQSNLIHCISQSTHILKEI